MRMWGPSAPAWPKGRLWKIEHLMPGDRDIHQRPVPLPLCFVCCLPCLFSIQYWDAETTHLLQSHKRKMESFIIIAVSNNRPIPSKETLAFFFCSHSQVISCVKKEMKISESHMHPSTDGCIWNFFTTRFSTAGRLHWPPFEWQLKEDHWEYQDAKNILGNDSHAD